MIDELLEIIKEEVDTFLKLKINDRQDRYIHLSPVVDLEGKPPVNENSVCMSLIKIEEDRNNMSNGGQTERVGNEFHSYNPPIKLNLVILFSAAYLDGQEKNYLEGVKRLSLVVSFFQSKNVFTSQNTPRLDPAYGAIKADFYSLSMEEQNQLWGMLGGSYRPSVLYRLRALLIQEKFITRVTPSVTSSQSQVGAKE